MYPVRDGDCLCRIERYELVRDAEQFTIEVIVSLAGGGDHRCEALLYHLGDLADELCGGGDSVGAAVRDLLLKIQGYTAEDLFPFFEKNEPT